MATAINAPYSTEIKLGPQPQNFALKFITGKNLGNSKFAPFLPRVLFTAIDDRKLFLEAEDASDFERALRDLGVQSGDFVAAARVKLPRGGHSIQVKRVDESAAPSQTRQEFVTATETLLAKSVEMAREHGPSAFIAAAPVADAQPVKITPAAVQMCAAMCAAVDAIIETQAYAQRRGLGVTFSEESVRAIGLSIYISAAKGGR